LAPVEIDSRLSAVVPSASVVTPTENLTGNEAERHGRTVMEVAGRLVTTGDVWHGGPGGFGAGHGCTGVAENAGVERPSRDEPVHLMARRVA
jgi:hypothetical protein